MSRSVVGECWLDDCCVSSWFYIIVFVFFFKQKTAYEMRISDWSSDVCSSDLVIAVDQTSEDGHQLFREGNRVGWAAREPGTGDTYLALFNLGDAPESVSTPLTGLGLGEGVAVRDLWAGAPIATVRRTFGVTLPPHGAGLFRLSAV